MDAVDESQVEGKAKTVFEDIRATLGVSTVGLLFRRLAAEPWFLDLAWRNLKPNAETEYFHRTATKLFQAANDAASIASGSFDSQLSNENSRAFADAVADLCDTQAKLLLATAALRAGVNGQLPRMNLLSTEEKRVYRPAEPPAGSGDSRASSPTAMQESLLSEIGEALELGSSPSDLHELLSWPVTLANVWSKVKEPLGQRLDAAVALARQAESAVEALPFRLEISSTACRQSGLSEDEIDAVKARINEAFDSAPRLLLALSALQAFVRPQTNWNTEGTEHRRH